MPPDNSAACVVRFPDDLNQRVLVLLRRPVRIACPHAVAFTIPSARRSSRDSARFRLLRLFMLQYRLSAARVLPLSRLLRSQFPFHSSRLAPRGFESP